MAEAGRKIEITESISHATWKDMKNREHAGVLLEALMTDIDYTLCSGTAGSLLIHSVSADSRNIIPGSLFVAIQGGTTDGHDFIDKAVSAGARAVLVNSETWINRPIEVLEKIVVIGVDDTKEVLGTVASRFFGNPAERMKMIGITGTNGKTTISYLMEHVLSQSGLQVGVIGTVNYRFHDINGALVSYPASFTTPDPLALFGILKEMHDGGVTHVLMEVSSHALEQKRVGPLTFALAIFTNLSQDHLDYHRTMADYFAAKSLLFREKMVAGASVVFYQPDFQNRQKRVWTDKLASLCGELSLVTIQCGPSDDARFKLASSQIDRSGTSFHFIDPKGDMLQIQSPLIGHFNIENLLVSVAALTELGLEQASICKHLSHAKGAPGRMQRVSFPIKRKELPVVLVDYSHTPDALENALATLKTLPHRNLFCVFGCGGDRDRGKRPQMGEIAVRYSDVAIITDDNPRSEVPSKIRQDIIDSEAIGRGRMMKPDWLFHRKKDERGCVEIAGRSEAIGAAVHYGGAEDIVLIAGKGHEKYQITETGKSFFDDCLSVQEHSLGWDVELVSAASKGTIIVHGADQRFKNISTDSRSIGHDDIFVALSGESFNGHDYLEKGIRHGAACLVISEDRSVTGDDVACVKVDDTLTALGNLAGWRRQALKSFNNPVVVGITGSCGKTTVKEMTASIFTSYWPEKPDEPPNRVLKTTGNFNNLIGLPLSLLPASVGQKGIILEMGMNQPGEIGRLTQIADPDIACITNVHGAHLEGLGTIENVARAKAELFSGSREGSVHVVNLDDERIVAWSRKYPNHKQVTYGVSDRAVSQSPDIWATNMIPDSAGHMSFVLHIGKEQKTVKLQAPGLHNCANSCAAAAIAYSAGIDFGAIVDGLENFTSTANRMESMRSQKGLNILNDTYNANPASMTSALDTVKAINSVARVAILGDMLELGAEAVTLHTNIGRHVADSHIDFLGVFGTLAENIANGAIKHGMKPDKVVIFDDKQRIVDWVAELLHSGQLHPDDWILVKASRGLALDTIVDQLMQLC
jgi:murE/murF fusion protein